MVPIDSQTMREIAPTFTGAPAAAQAKIIAEAGAVLAATLDAYAINTRLRIAHFLGQTCEESAGYRTTEEFASGKEYNGRTDLGNTHNRVTARGSRDAVCCKSQDGRITTSMARRSELTL